MAQQLILDTRLPPSDLPLSDPAHPKNLMRRMIMVRNQANADTRYDILPPKRVEPFAASFCGSNMRDWALFAALCAGVLLAVYLLLTPRSTLQRFVLIAAVILGTHYAIGMLENLTVYNLSKCAT